MQGITTEGNWVQGIRDLTVLFFTAACKPTITSLQKIETKSVCFHGTPKRNLEISVWSYPASSGVQIPVPGLGRMWSEHGSEDQNWEPEASPPQRRLPEDSHHLQALWQAD